VPVETPRGAPPGKKRSLLCAIKHKTDAATGEHGDLLDLIAGTCRLSYMPEVLAEARRFLCLPRDDAPQQQMPVPTGSREAARRLFAMARPIRSTLAQTYLRRRGITYLGDLPALRFHPQCFYRDTAPGHGPTSRQSGAQTERTSQSR
jgi:hypothetical protein